MRGDEKREKQRINRLHVEDVQFERVRHDKIKPQTDDTKVSRKHITTEKVEVNRGGVTQVEETEKSKYPKEIDVGRIVIEEIPEEKEKMSRREVRDVTKDREKDDTVKIGRLDLCDLENEAVVSTKTEKRLVTTRDKIDHGKFVTDRHIGMKTTREPTVTEEKLKMGSGPTDKICINFSKTGQQKPDKTDGRWIVDEKTSEKKAAIKDVDVVRGHEIVNDSVWKESLKPLDEEQQESIVPGKPVPSETIVVTKEDRKKQTEDVKVTVRKVESAGNKAEKIKIRRFKIDESRDPKGAKKNEAINEIPVKEVKRKEPKPYQKPKEPKERRSKEMETKTREKVQRQDKNLEQYEKKERSRRVREHQRYDEECYQMKKSSSDPWIQVRKQKKPQDFEIRATQVIHDPTKYIEEYDQGAGRKPATLPWIEVRKRASEKQRGKSLAAGKKSRHAYQLTKEQVERDRLLLLKIPQKIFISTQSGGQSIMKEVEIPWMEIEASRDVDGDGLPWIQLEACDSKTERDRLIMLKIPREMVLKTSKSKNTEREIQLSWNDVTRYWEETGQIPLGSATHMRTKHSPCMSITLPQESSGRLKVNRNQAIDDSLPTIRLIMPKKLYAEKSWQDKPLINFDPNRRIKLRINNQFNSAEDVRTIRLGEYERKNNYVPVALTRGYPRRVLLADGMEWKRLEVDNLERLDKEIVQRNPSRFSNAYEIGAEGESHSFPDLREFAKQNGGNSTENPKVFSFVIKGDK